MNERNVRPSVTSRPITAADRDAADRVMVLTLAERLFTVKEYTQLCADIANGSVEVRMYDDGIVLTRDV